MSLDQLIQADPSPIQRAVLAVLTGLPIADAAHQHRMDPVILSDAVAVYDQAGREALARHASTTDWWQVYLHFTDWANADTTFTTSVLPILWEAEAAGTIDGWWYTRKHPAGACAFTCGPRPGPSCPSVTASTASSPTGTCNAGGPASTSRRRQCSGCGRHDGRTPCSSPTAGKHSSCGNATTWPWGRGNCPSSCARS